MKDAMVKLTGFDGKTHYVSVQNIARITEAGTSSMWHGIRAYVKLFDGVTLEVQESASQIHAMIEKENAINHV